MPWRTRGKCPRESISCTPVEIATGPAREVKNRPRCKATGLLHQSQCVVEFDGIVRQVGVGEMGDAIDSGAHLGQLTVATTAMSTVAGFGTFCIGGVIFTIAVYLGVWHGGAS